MCSLQILLKENLMEIVRELSFNFEKYLKKLIEVSLGSPLEINYQLEIIKPFLEDVFDLQKYQIPDVSANSERKSKKHDRTSYALHGYSSPDLLITKGFRFENIGKKPTIFATIEVKEQSSQEIFNREIKATPTNKEYSIDLINQIVSYLCLNNKTIVTNCRRWHFFNVKQLNNSEYDYLKEYSQIALTLGEKKKNETVEEQKIRINNLWMLVKSSKHEKIKKLIDESIEKNEAWYESSSITLKNTAREYIAKCETKKIDLLPNRKPIREEQFTEEIEPDKFVSDLIGLEKTKVINTPKEWYDLINYMGTFINY